MVAAGLSTRLCRRVGAAGLVLAAGLWIPVAQAACSDWNPIDNRAAALRRPVTAADLIGLVNIGRPDAEPIGGPSPLALSPDGRHLALVLQRADLQSNSYCQALLVIDPRGREPPRILDRGGDYLVTRVTMRAMVVPNGFPRLNAPAWSRDGRSIAYLRRDLGRTRLWLAPARGGVPVPVSRSDMDVEAWAWSRDGRSLLYATASAADVEAGIDREGRAGWHYDARMVPAAGTRPQAGAPGWTTVKLDPDTGTLTPADAPGTRLVALDGEDPLDRRRAGARGDLAWAERDGSSPLAPSRLRVTDMRGSPYPCTADACRGHFLGLWWDRDGRRLSFLKLEGWNERFTALYRWVPGKGAPVNMLRTDDVVAGCLPAGAALLCVREGASAPPRIVSIDPETGAGHLVFDPNPGFGLLALGSVRRLEWRTDQGRAVYGDLVLPPGYRAGTRLPTLVVQYSSRGFLRGGTGNEYPIYLMAGRGFAVLSIQKPPMVAASFPDLRIEEIAAANGKDWAERRNVNSAIEAGVRLLVDQGIADPARLGITGLSDGASSARFALINTRLFAAAAISSCCVDEYADMLEGPAWADYGRTIGYPPAWPIDSAFWRPWSFPLNADRMTTPLLLQLADSELLTALPSYTALAARHQPVDLYVFPDEFHIKWQPEHRRAVFERDLDWFSFWLQDREDPAPAKVAQYVLWRSLRAARMTAVAEQNGAPVASSPP